MLKHPLVIVISGLINTGSIQERPLCRRLPRTAHVEVDVLCKFVSWMSLEKNLDINIRNAAAVARNFLEYGLNVVFSYSFRRRNYDFLEKKFRTFPLYCVTLVPPMLVAQSNRGARPLTDWEKQRIAFHYTTDIVQPNYGMRSVTNCMTCNKALSRWEQRRRA